MLTLVLSHIKKLNKHISDIYINIKVYKLPNPFINSQLQLNRMSKSVNVESQTNKAVQYDDELDEDFEEQLVKTSTSDELQKTLDSFEDPKGIEESESSNLLNGPQMNTDFLENLKKNMNSKQRTQFQKMLANVVAQEKFGLGTNPNLSTVSEEHKTDSAKRLRQILAEKRFGRKSKFAQLHSSNTKESTNTELRRKDGNDGLDFEPDPDSIPDSNQDQDVENLDGPEQVSNNPTPHVHSVACAHDHGATNVHDATHKGKNAKRNKKRRDAAKLKVNIETR